MARLKFLTLKRLLEIKVIESGEGIYRIDGQQKLARYWFHRILRISNIENIVDNFKLLWSTEIDNVLIHDTYQSDLFTWKLIVIDEYSESTKDQ